jgi:multicomponent Na+:H+ antiporter subunit C
MDVLLPFIVGILYGVGIYLMLHRSYIKILIGMAILGHGINLFLFSVSRLTRGRTALIPEEATQLEGVFADPIPQALILTAIVIGFGIQAFAIVLFRRAYQATGAPDINNLNHTDQLDEL